MPYTALPDHHMPYDNDGTVVGIQGAGDWWWGSFEDGISFWRSGATLIELNDGDRVVAVSHQPGAGYGPRGEADWFWFPEQREVTGMFVGWTGGGSVLVDSLQGSNNTTNGVDGSWETASLPAGNPSGYLTLDAFRALIKSISFTGAKKTIRFRFGGGYVDKFWIYQMHIYGEKAAGQTPDDIIYINHDDTPGVEYTAPEDFGDQPLGTTVVRQFRIKNTSATKTANTINIQCNDSDFSISENGTTWVVTINIASLAAGAESSTLYVRCVTPAAGGLLGPRFARIVTTVASYT